jgi:UDP-3-O-[3-hydroxymyristoyl] N-acetylglucosamine deacetylase
VSIAVVEHLLAALRICKITDAIVEIEGDEVPIMDGSAVEFTNKFLNVGLRYRNSMVPALVIADEITVSSKSGRISVRPSKERKISVELSCERLGSLVDGRNCYSFKLDDDLNNIAESRTFGWLDDYCEIRKRGMARGASEDNTIVILSDGTVKNAGGLRHEKEIVMHKCLDLIGDLCVLECDIIGDITAINPSHALNNSFVMEIGKAFRSYSKMAARPSRQFLDRASLRGFAR